MTSSHPYATFMSPHTAVLQSIDVTLSLKCAQGIEGVELGEVCFELSNDLLEKFVVYHLIK